MKRESSKMHGKNNKKTNMETKTTRKSAYRDGNAKDCAPTNKGANDPLWYSKYPELVRDAANIPFNLVTGKTIEVTGKSKFGVSYQVPGIMAIEVVPTIGTAISSTDAVNVAATSLYSFVRHANSGSPNYDAPNLMMYMLAMSQVYSYITYLERVYGCATLYSSRNRYMPEALLKANGVNFNDVNNNLANLRYGINVLINKAAAFAVPADMPLFLRHAFLFQHVYTEGSSVKDQMYMYVPAGFYKYVEMVDTAPSRLEFQRLDMTQAMTVDQLLQFGNDLLQPLLQSEDLGIMSGDILKAYGKGGCITLTPFPEVYPLVPINNPMVLEQMKNAMVINPGDMDMFVDHLTINENVPKGTITCIPSVFYETNAAAVETYDTANVLINAYRQSHILSTLLPETDPAAIMEMTRLTFTVDAPVHSEHGGKKYLAGHLHIPTEVAIGVRIYGMYVDLQGETQYTVTQYHSHELYTNFDYNTFLASSEIVNKGKSFAYAPNMYQHSLKDGNTVAHFAPFVDYNNFAVLDAACIDRLNDTAILSEFSVPIVNRL
jgi:hypothetical protein